MLVPCHSYTGFEGLGGAVDLVVGDRWTEDTGDGRGVIRVAQGRLRLRREIETPVVVLGQVGRGDRMKPLTDPALVESARLGERLAGGSVVGGQHLEQPDAQAEVHDGAHDFALLEAVEVLNGLAQEFEIEFGTHRHAASIRVRSMLSAMMQANCRMRSRSKGRVRLTASDSPFR